MHWVARALRRPDQRGAAAVEFALICIPFIFLIFGLIQYGWYFYVASSTSGAASNVARRLEVGDCWDAGEADQFARNESPYIVEAPDGVVSDPATLTGAVPGETQISVTVTADANIIGFVPVPNDGMVTRIVKVRLEDVDEGAPCLATP